jgi:hypothetical protein
MMRGVRICVSATRRAEVASAEAKQSLERQGDYRSIQEQLRAPRRREILYSFVGAVPTSIVSLAIAERCFLTKLEVIARFGGRPQSTKHAGMN